MQAHCCPTAQAWLEYAALSSTVSGAMSQPTFLSLSVNFIPWQIRLCFQWTLSLASLPAFGLSEGFSLGWMFGLIKVPVWHLLLPLSGQCVLVCIVWESVCVLRVYVCAWLFVLYCVFTPMTWPPCSLKGSGNTMGAPPFSFLISSLLLYVTICHSSAE